MDLKADRFLDLFPDLIATLDRDGRFLYANPAFARLSGQGHEDLIGRHFSRVIRAADRPIANARLAAAGSLQSVARFDARLETTKGEHSRLRWTVQPDPDAHVLYVVGHAARETFEEGELLRIAVEASPCAMIVVDQQGLLTKVNQATEQLFGYGPGELIGQPVEVLVPEHQRSDHTAQRQQFQTEAGSRPMGRGRDLMGRKRDGSVFPVEVGLSRVFTSRGEYVLGAVVDLTVRKETEQRIASQAHELAEANARLSEMASTDSLTNLWNRRSFVEQLGIQLETALRNSRPLSVLILDTDHFKPYNDNYGHLAGDVVLQQVAKILRGSARRSDYVARLGGEEFGVISPETTSGGAIRVGERFRGAIEAASWPRRSVTASVGATTVHHPKDAWRAEPPSYSSVLAEADKALYYSKEHGRNRVTHLHEMLQ
ncbi:MAG: diguanylate cyclase [Gemmatimonadota bacterium]|nr:MAG: diguanylate cyclase [Gemmatimonadota bacterium]